MVTLDKVTTTSSIKNVFDCIITFDRVITKIVSMIECSINTFNRKYKQK